MNNKMDNSTRNRNRVRLWLCRLLNFNQNSNNNNNKITTNQSFEEDADTNQSTTNCTQTRKSFRKSLRKMQTSMKSCIIQNRTKSSIPTRNSTEIVDISCNNTATNSAQSSVIEEQQNVDRRNEETRLAPSKSSDDHPNHRIPTEEIQSLASCYWYWGPMSTSKAEEMLKFKPDGTFLVRDSSSASYLFSISFRSVGKTMHARIEYNRGKYNLYGSFTDGYTTITELIQDAIRISENDVYCYSRKSENDCDFPVRFTQPISRYQEVRSLKYLSRFVIRQYTNINDISTLPVPRALHNYLLETPYF